MSHESTLSLRLPPELVDRLDQLLDVLRGQPGLQWSSLSRSAVARMAIERGLVELEKEVSGAKKKRRGKR